MKDSRIMDSNILDLLTERHILDVSFEKEAVLVISQDLTKTIGVRWSG